MRFSDTLVVLGTWEVGNYGTIWTLGTQLTIHAQVSPGLVDATMSVWDLGKDPIEFIIDNNLGIYC